ncbi:MAG: hypothetical protein ACD_69C00034G0001, partial [uncultured bacterium]
FLVGAPGEIRTPDLLVRSYGLISELLDLITFLTWDAHYF